MNADTITYAAERITDRCGWYMSGTFVGRDDGNPEGFNIGYMRYSAGLDFCTNALTSGQNCCP
jgi:hypothetical protein